MEKINFVVTLTFSGNITTDDDSLQEIAQKIAESLKHTVNTSEDGIAPVGCDEYTKLIEVSHSGIIMATEKLGI